MLSFPYDVTHLWLRNAAYIECKTRPVPAEYNVSILKISENIFKIRFFLEVSRNMSFHIPNMASKIMTLTLSGFEVTVTLQVQFHTIDSHVSLYLKEQNVWSDKRSSY
jgi:hypothetical protein